MKQMTWSSVGGLLVCRGLPGGSNVCFMSVSISSLMGPAVTDDLKLEHKLLIFHQTQLIMFYM